mgnify:CR=1 FL=1
MLAKEINYLLKSQNKTIAVAESCTGGLVSKILTDIPGSSDYFLLGIVAYSNAAKIKLLSIPKSLLSKYGAVSKPIAEKLALNVRKLAKTDFGIGITGIAGPSGGSKEKPVGTVYGAVSSPHLETVRRFSFPGERSRVQALAVAFVLDHVRRSLG